MITAIFENNQLVSYLLKTWQYDYGQILRIEGLNLPTAVEIHFSLTEKGGEAVTRVGMTKDGVTDVVIPDGFLENNDIAQDYRIYAFIYLRDDTSGQTEYKIPISVTSRPKPEAFNRPEDGEIFKEAIQAVRESKTAAETAKESAETAAESARQSATAVEQAVSGFDEKVAQSSTAIESAKTEAVKAVKDKGDEVLQSIPPDFETQMANKVDKQQGIENKGKALVVGDDGNVIPVEKPSGGGEKWRFLRTVTVPADPKTDQSGVVWKLNSDGAVLGFAFDTDENGEKFSLDDVRWYGKVDVNIVETQDGKYIYLTATDEPSINLYRMTCNVAKSVFGFLNRTVDRLYPLEFYNTEYSQIPKVICGTGNSNAGIIFNKKITAFGFLNTQNTFKEGTVYHVYGKE